MFPIVVHSCFIDIFMLLLHNLPFVCLRIFGRVLLLKTANQRLIYPFPFSGYVLTFYDATFYLFSTYITLSCLTYCDLLQTQRDTTGLTTENRELKLRLQSMEEQAKLRDGMRCSSFETFLDLLVVIFDCS